MKSAVRLILLTYLLLLAIPTVADNPDFSGSYTLTGGDRRADAQKATVVTITVVQTPTDVEITKLKDGQKMVNRVTLDGKSGVFNNLQGPFGTCQAHMKGKTPILEISGTVRIEKTDFKMSLHSTEVWQLSSDSKTLTIRGADVLLTPTVNHLPLCTEIYARN
jgi:hypothetical protein